jgi:hypothetical protein
LVADLPRNRFSGVTAAAAAGCELINNETDEPS